MPDKKEIIECKECKHCTWDGSKYEHDDEIECMKYGVTLKYSTEWYDMDCDGRPLKGVHIIKDIWQCEKCEEENGGEK